MILKVMSLVSRNRGFVLDDLDPGISSRDYRVGTNTGTRSTDVVGVGRVLVLSLYRFSLFLLVFVVPGSIIIRRFN